MRSKRMLVLAGVFFNKLGNQSLFETIKGYTAEYKVDIVSAASFESDFYYTIGEMNRLIPEVTVYRADSRFLYTARYIRCWLQKMLSKIFARKEAPLQLQSHNRISNTSASLINRFSSSIRAHRLFTVARKLLESDRNPYDVVCAYGTISIRPAIKIINRYLPTAKVFGKFQGTVLGSVIDELDDRSVKRQYRIDMKGLVRARYLDGYIMTNDGTRGKEVLQKFGAQANRILFVPNGVSKLCEEKQKEVRESKHLLSYPISLFTLSRLIYWKRVDLGPKIISMLVNKFNNENFRLTIFGTGNTEDVRRIRATIKEYNVSDYVDYRGPVPYEKTPEIFAGYDILLSLYIMNNITNPLLEAVFYGIPVMTIYKPDLAELIGERVKGCIMLKDSENEKELIQQAAEQLNNTDIGRLQEMYSYMENGSTNIGTWDQRMSKELEFIRNLKRRDE